MDVHARKVTMDERKMYATDSLVIRAAALSATSSGVPVADLETRRCND